MRGFLKKYPAVLMLMASLFLMGADNGEQGTDEQTKLLERQQQLNARIETLKQEQDYLLFQKTMYASDSKYLLINSTARTGQLKYKNRVLKDFHFTSAGRPSLLKQGAVTLTKKIDGSKTGRLLVFGTSLVLQDRRVTAAQLRATEMPRFSLSKKDLQSVFYAVEVGAKAYVIF